MDTDNIQKIVDLSHSIITDMHQWPTDDSPLRIVRRSEHGSDSHQSSALDLGCHVGTHIDTPLHFLAGQPGLEEMSPSAFFGRAIVISVRGVESPGLSVLEGFDLDGLDFALLETGWAERWGTDAYYTGWPVPDFELVDALIAAGLKGLGVDTPSVDHFDGHRNHDELAAVGMINIENLANLGALPAKAFTFLALPLKLAGAEASPVRAVALI